MNATKTAKKIDMVSDDRLFESAIIAEHERRFPGMAAQFNLTVEQQRAELEKSDRMFFSQFQF